MIDKITTSKYMGAKTNGLSIIITGITVPELILYLAVIINLMFSLAYPVYNAIHEYYHLIAFSFAVLLIVCEINIKINIINTVKIILLVAISMMILYLNNSGFGVIIQILWPLTIIYVIKRDRFSGDFINRITFLMLVGWLMAFLAANNIDPKFFEYIEAGIEVDSLNPNTIAIIIVFTALFLELYVDSHSKSKLVKMIIYMLSLIALYQTQSRTSMIAYMLVLVLGMFVNKTIRKSRKIGMLIVVTVVAVGIVFPLIYTMLYFYDVISYHTLFMGKRIFTGRQYIWLNLYEYLQVHTEAYLIGVGYNTELFSRGTFNLHNAYLMIFAQYGIPFLLVFLRYIYCSIKKMYDNVGQISDLQFKCYQVIIYTLLVGVTETILSYLPNMIFIAMAIGIGIRSKKMEEI